MAKTKKKSPTMTEKVQIKLPEEKQGIFPMIMSMIVVSLGILLVVTGVVLIVLFRREPKIDRAIKTPEVVSLPVATNVRNIVVKGDAEDVNNVMVWINDDLVDSSLPVEDGRFRYVYEFEKEGDYKVEVAGVKGFPIRLRSEKSFPQTVAVDWTAPSKDVSFDYKSEVDTETFTLTGNLEPNTTVVLEGNGSKYVAKSDDKGVLSMEGVDVTLGDNSFNIELRDDAGNRTVLDQKVTVAMVAGTVNGGAASDLPESAGELSLLLDNKVMTGFGFVALLGMLLSSGVVVTRFKKESV